MSFGLPLLWLILAFFAINLSGCGSNPTEVDVKDYRLAVVSGDAQTNAAFSQLVERYNNEAGFHALSFVSDPATANSAIVLTPNLLQTSDGKVGWGQWITETKDSNSMLQVVGGDEKKTVTYSMRVEFDDQFVRQRLNSTDPEAQYDLYKLFAHEVGHGFQMTHDPDPAAVMYYDITGTKDFNGYFKSVRAFFGRS